jgi:hypothetical protein
MQNGFLFFVPMCLCFFVPYAVGFSRQQLTYHEGNLRQKSLSSFCHSRPNFLS